MSGLGGLNKSAASISYRLPWEERVQITDGSSRGFAQPDRSYREARHG